MNQKEKIVALIHRILPSVCAVAIFFAVSAVCFAPQFEGRVLPRHDIQQFDGMSRDIRDCRTSYGEDPQWTGAMFGGMPAYLINIRYPAQIVKRTFDTVFKAVATPTGFTFFAMLAAWLMAILMGMPAWVGVIVGLAYGLSTYFFLIIGAGHDTKMWALVYAPALMGAIYKTSRGNMFYGGALVALFATLEIGANHPQITYYFLLAAVALWLNDGVFAIREKRLCDFGKRTAILAVGAMLAIGANFAPLWYTARHSSATTRGGSEVVAEKSGAKSGLDLQYATAWSYGLAESWNMIIPDLAGGDSARTFSADGAVAKAMDRVGAKEYARMLPTYWGGQPYTAGPTYLGIVALLLAVVGLLLAEARDRWWIVAISILALLLSWGHNVMWFTEWCFGYLPMYNRFRAVSTALVVIEWSVPLLAGFGLWRMWLARNERRRLLRAVAWATGIVGSVVLILTIGASSWFDFGREESGEMMSRQFYEMLRQSDMNDYIARGLHDELGWEVADAMAEERMEIMRADGWRSLVFIVIAALSLIALAYGKIRKKWTVALVFGVLIVVDMVAVEMRYLPYDKFVSKREVRMVATDADKAIMADKEIGFRVINLDVSPFNDATTSMFHRSVGGYHGAKLGRYQDVIDHYLSKLDDGVLDVLNTKYAIYDGRAINRETSFGPAWFVEDCQYSSSAKEALEMLGTTDLRHTAVVEGEDLFAECLAEEDNRSIAIVEYRPNYLRYNYTSSVECVAVFSEIYYADGWTMYIDGEQSPYFRADYILRAAVLPAGEHCIEWRYKAPHWAAVEAVTLICSLLIFCLLILTTIYYIKHEKSQFGTTTQD